MITVTVPAPTLNKRPKTKGKLKKGPDGKLAPTTPRAAFLNANQRINHNEKSKITKMWREAACEAVKEMEIHWPGGRRLFGIGFVHLPREVVYDAANYYPTFKAVIDGITDSGKLWPDDNNDHFVGPLMVKGDKATRSVGGVRLVLFDIETRSDKDRLEHWLLSI